MPEFRSTAEIERYISDRIPLAVEKAKEYVLNIIEQSMLEFYNEYPQIEYKRTGELLKSMVDNGITGGIGGCGFEIYFDSSKMSHPRPYAIGQSGTRWPVEKDEEWILNNSFTGEAPHGDYEPAGGRPIWPEIVKGLGDTYIILYSALNEAGIPVR